MISYILQLLEMEKNKIVVPIGNLEAAAASLLALLQLYGANRENWKIKKKLKYIYYLLFPSLTPSVFVQELDMLKVNLTSQIPLYL